MRQLRTSVLRCFLSSVLSTCVLTQPLAASTITATNCSREAVQEAINLAADGDSVIVPAGSCTWTDKVTITNKEVYVFGAGVDQTNINWAPIQLPSNAAFWIRSDKVFRISGFTFTGQPGDKGIIMYNGYAVGFRIDNNKFLDINGKAFDISGGSGVIDHNSFLGRFKGMNLLGIGNPGVYFWDKPWVPGTSDAVFIEDNLFDHDNRRTSVSCHRGCRYVFRYNTVRRGIISTHGADSSDRAGGAFEAYNNTFTSDADHFTGVRMRGGTAIIFNNVWDGYTTAISFAQYRTCYGVSYPSAHRDHASRCDGSAIVDGNDARPGHSGIHDGGGNASELMDGTKSWQRDRFVGFHVYNLTDGSKCKIAANSETTVNCILAGGAENDWDSGDQYKVTSGWPCKDQVGRGPFQTSEPVYQWNNSHSRYGGPYESPEVTFGGYDCEDPSPEDQFEEGQDYFNNTPRPGYTPYVYPHPLTLEGSPDLPDPPRNLHVKEN